MQKSGNMPGFFAPCYTCSCHVGALYVHIYLARDLYCAYTSPLSRFVTVWHSTARMFLLCKHVPYQTK